MTKTAKVTIIIPNYNGRQFMEDCMKALLPQITDEVEVLLVDNASSDGSLEEFKQRYPQFPVLEMPENLGFSGAVNAGIRAAKSPYVILLNNDTKVLPGYVKELVRILDKNPKAFSASAKMIQMYHPELLDDAGDGYTVLGWAFQRGVGQSSRGYRRSCRVFSACAGAAIYRRSVFEEIGYFDEMHFAYLEDLDVGFRAAIYGWENLYCPRAKVLHVGSGTSGSKYNPFKVRLAARNGIYLNYKNMPAWQLILNAPFLITGIAVKSRFFKKLGFGAEYLDGLKEGIRTRKQCRRVPYEREHLKNYALIQLQIMAGTVLYIWEFLKRRLK